MCHKIGRTPLNGQVHNIQNELKATQGLTENATRRTFELSVDWGFRMAETHRRRDVGVAAVLLLLYLNLSSQGSAEGAVTCGIQDPTFSGRGYNPTYNVRGVEAEIDVRSGVLCQSGNGPDTFFTSWVMIANGGGSGYAQVGHMFKNFGTNHRFFYEYDVGPGGFTRVFWGSPVFGNHHNFRASRSTSDGHVHFTVEGNNPPGSVPGETNFDPFQEWPSTIAWWSSETAHIGSDVPGTPSNKTNYEFVHHKNNNEVWTLQNWNLVPQPGACYFSVAEVTSDSHFRSWTNSPTHSC